MSSGVELLEDRRRNPRKRVRQRALLKTSTGDKLECTVIEVSVNGVGVMLPRPLKVGLNCQLTYSIFLEGRNVTVSGVGKVMNCSCSGLDGFRIGMVFSIESPDVQQAIAQFVG